MTKRRVLRSMIGAAVGAALALGLAVALAQGVVVTLSPVIGSGTSATATLEPSGNQTGVTVAARGMVAGSQQMVAIALGTCASVGADQFALPDLIAGADGAGTLTASINAVLVTLQDGNHLILIRQGTSRAVLACGNIPRAATATTATSAATTAVRTPATTTTATATLTRALPKVGGLPLPPIPVGLLGAAALGMGIYLRRRTA